MRDKLVRLLFAVAWADNAMRPEEYWVIGAFSQGCGIAGERASQLADLAASQPVRRDPQARRRRS